MKYIKLLMFIAIVGLWTSCNKDKKMDTDPCLGVIDKMCSELIAEDFEMLCNTQNLTVTLTTSNSTSPFECKYKIRNDDGVVLLLNLCRYSSCTAAQNQFDFNKDFFSWDFIPIENLNDDSYYFKAALYQSIYSVKGKTLIKLTGYDDTDCSTQVGLTKLMRGLNDMLF